MDARDDPTTPTHQPKGRHDVLAFLRECKDNPDDDTPRLVLADWLQDNGDEHDSARGDCIRAQCEAAQLALRHPHWAELQERISRLSNAHAPFWLGRLQEVPHARSFRRGLLQLTLMARDLAAASPSLAAEEAYAWVDELRFRTAPLKSLQKLIDTRFLDNLNSLDLGRCNLRGSGLFVLVHGADLGNLRKLDLEEDWISEEGVRTLVASTNLRRLQVLNLASNHLGERALEMLGDSSLLARLEALNLDSNHLGDAPLKTLARSPQLGNLRSLSLGQNRLGDAGAIALAGAESLTSLKHLNLTSNSLSGPGIEALANSRQLATLETLDLCNNAMAGEGAWALARSRYLGNLKELHFTGMYLTPDAQEVLRDRFGDALRL